MKNISKKKPVKKRSTKPSPPKSSRGPKPARRRAEPLPLPPENAQAKALATKIAQRVSEKKGMDIFILDVRGKTSYADYVVIASGESERQVSAMAENVETKLKEEGLRPLGTEGYDTGHWVLLDYGEVVVHLFYADVRTFYDLEGLWSDAPKEKVA